MSAQKIPQDRCSKVQTQTLVFRFSQIWDLESEVNRYHIMLIQKSSDSANLVLAADRWHALDMQVPTIQFNSLEFLEHQVKYKVIFRVVNKAELSTIIESAEFIWDESPFEWSKAPSSVSNKSTTASGVHYVYVTEQVRFKWDSNGQDFDFFSIATCIYLTASWTTWQDFQQPVSLPFL